MATVIHPDDIDRYHTVIADSSENLESYELEFRVRNIAGEYRWVRGYGSPLRQEDGSTL